MTARARKILYGTLIALGCFVALLVLLVISFSVWVGRPGELIEPERLVSADSTGYAEWSLRLEDPGTEGFMHLLVEAISSILTNTTVALVYGCHFGGACRASATLPASSADEASLAWHRQSVQ